MPSTSLSRLLRILFLIALSAVWAGAHAEFALQLGGRKDAQGAASVSTPHVRAELLAHAPEGVAPGRPLWLGLRISHQPGWHTYWKTPATLACPPSCAGSCRLACRRAKSPGPCRVCCAWVIWSTTVTKARCCWPCRCRSRRALPPPRGRTRCPCVCTRAGWCAASSASRKRATLRCSCRCAAPWP